MHGNDDEHDTYIRHRNEAQRQSDDEYDAKRKKAAGESIGGGTIKSSLGLWFVGALVLFGINFAVSSIYRDNKLIIGALAIFTWLYYSIPAYIVARYFWNLFKPMFTKLK